MIKIKKQGDENNFISFNGEELKFLSKIGELIPLNLERLDAFLEFKGDDLFIVSLENFCGQKAAEIKFSIIIYNDGEIEIEKGVEHVLKFFFNVEPREVFVWFDNSWEEEEFFQEIGKILHRPGEEFWYD